MENIIFHLCPNGSRFMHTNTRQIVITGAKSF